MAPQRRYTVGRAHDCNIAIAHDSVSRTHAEVELRGDGSLLVRDLGSQNGTVLLRKGREFPLTEEVVFPTDTLRFGEVAISAREVLNILKSSGEQDSPAQPELKAAPAGAGVFVRCGCGTVKPRGQRCPACGE
jgi:pSer/pThr/pTyr-binding forkhead associated (FHA) protein